MIDVVILTSSLQGAVSIQLEELLKSKIINVKAVIFNKGELKDKNKYYKRKLSKVLKIGLFGAINGIRMRKWYTIGSVKYLAIKSIDEICKANKTPFLITPTINSSPTISFFEDAKADIGLSLGNGYISNKVFSIPKWGMINIHHEVLPDYQNAQSIIWQLFNNSTDTGYTIHEVDKYIDTGKILYQEKIPITFRINLSDTVSFNYAELWKKSAIGLVKVLEDFEKYSHNSISQGQGTSYTTPSLFQYLRILKNFRKIKRLQTPGNVQKQ